MMPELQLSPVAKLMTRLLRCCGFTLGLLKPSRRLTRFRLLELRLLTYLGYFRRHFRLLAYFVRLISSASCRQHSIRLLPLSHPLSSLPPSLPGQTQHHPNTPGPSPSGSNLIMAADIHRAPAEMPSNDKQPTPSPTPTMRRARQACRRCNERKLRCDVMDSQPCKNCARADALCEVVPSRRGK